MKKQLTSEPMELSIFIKEISPMVAPTRSFRSRRVGPMIPRTNPSTVQVEMNNGGGGTDQTYQGIHSGEGLFSSGDAKDTSRP